MFAVISRVSTTSIGRSSIINKQIEEGWGIIKVFNQPKSRQESQERIIQSRQEKQKAKSKMLDID